VEVKGEMFYLIIINLLFNWSAVIRKQHKKQEVKYIPLCIFIEYTPDTELSDLQISFLLHIKSWFGNFVLFYFILFYFILFYFILFYFILW